MSKSKRVDKEMEENIVQFCGITGASDKDARKFLEKYKRMDQAMDAYYNDPNALAATEKRQGSGPSTSKLNSLFDRYKDPNGEDITADGTIKLCSDLGVDPEDVVLLAVAFELKSPRLGEWNKKGWTDGWKQLGCDNIQAMTTSLGKLRDKLGSDPDYFQQVYNHTFDFARAEGQRSLALEMAQAFWGLLLPHGLKGGALSHINNKDEDEDEDMSGEEGWQEEHTQWWFEFLNEKKFKGISKDTWVVFRDFVRTIDSKFEKHDVDAAWPSAVDDFVEWVKEKKEKSK
jgi:DCN1-like protein 1/2